MTINQQAKAEMDTATGFADAGASQGARRATEEAPASAAPSSRFRFSRPPEAALESSSNM